MRGRCFPRLVVVSLGAYIFGHIRANTSTTAGTISRSNFMVAFTDNSTLVVCRYGASVSTASETWTQDCCSVAIHPVRKRLSPGSSAFQCRLPVHRYVKFYLGTNSGCAGDHPQWGLLCVSEKLSWDSILSPLINR